MPRERILILNGLDLNLLGRRAQGDVARGAVVSGRHQRSTAPVIAGEVMRRADR